MAVRQASPSADSGYTAEVSLPWSAIGGRPARGQGWGVNYGLRRTSETGAARTEYVSGNAPNRPAQTWQRITRSSDKGPDEEAER